MQREGAPHVLAMADDHLPVWVDAVLSVYRQKRLHSSLPYVKMAMEHERRACIFFVVVSHV